MRELGHKEDWVPKNGCFQIVVLEKTLESPLDCKEIKPVSPKGNQPWILIGRIDAEAEAPILRPSDAKSQLIWINPDAGKDWGQEKRTTENEMVGWYHQLHGHEFEQIPGDSEGQGRLECCSPWVHKELDTIKWLNNNKHFLDSPDYSPFHEPVKLLSSVQFFAIPWAVAYQALPSIEFSRQEYWSGLPFPSLRDLLEPGIEPRSPAL